MATGSLRDELGAGQTIADNRIRIVTGLCATVQSLGWIGMEAGIFRRLGLEVTFPRLETGGPEAAAGLIRGDWEFAETGSSHLIQGVLDGHDTVILLTPTAPSPSGTTIILTRPEISEPGQLNGMRIGVLTGTGQTTISLRVALRTWGVTATLVPLQPLPRPSASGIQKLLHELAVDRPAAGVLWFSAVIDGSFLDELDRNGIVRDLYAR